MGLLFNSLLARKFKLWLAISFPYFCVWIYIIWHFCRENSNYEFYFIFFPFFRFFFKFSFLIWFWTIFYFLIRVKLKFVIFCCCWNWSEAAAQFLQLYLLMMRLLENQWFRSKFIKYLGRCKILWFHLEILF